MYYFIVNPHASSGKGMRVWKQVQRRLTKPGMAQNYQVFITEKTGDARAFSRRLTEKCRENKILIVIGGDGTLNEVVDGSCLDSDQVCIAFIPVGVNNDFARSYPKKYRYRLKERLYRILFSEEERRLDYGVLSSENGSRRFAVSLGIGFDAALFHELLAERDRACRTGLRLFRSDRLSYLLAFLKELKKARKSRGYVILDGEQRIEFNNIIFLSAHVHPYEGGYLLGSGASGEDGYLDLCVVSTRQKLRIVRIMLSALFGAHKKMTGVHCYRCREAEIHTEQLLPVHTDGEIVGALQDFVIRCVPRKLRIRL